LSNDPIGVASVEAFLLTQLLLVSDSTYCLIISGIILISKSLAAHKILRHWDPNQGQNMS